MGSIAKNDQHAVWQPLKVGDIELKHRIAMAPLTRCRADDKRTHHDVAREYYGQRATEPGTLLISEATFISPQAAGWPNAPGVYTDDQVAAWKKVVDEVHSKGSFIYLQLWALGRAADAKNLKEQDGIDDVVSFTDEPFEGGAKPRMITRDEMKQYVKEYAQAAKNFIEKAGGDGVEIHSANGYLLQQSIHSVSNKRTDEYGGSVENRLRFPLEVVDAIVEAVGSSKVGIRVSPYTRFQGMETPVDQVHETYTVYAQELKKRNLAYTHFVESRIAGNTTVDSPDNETPNFWYDILKPTPFLIAGGFDRDDAEPTADQYENSVVVYGRHFLANPDIVRRIREKLPFNDYDRDTFYKTGPKETHGYIDYPFYDDSKK
ncbi:hypothetical protein OIO90_001642 [Microbotryomycetes sp. JL221]|nr:hypothetical protein OIO90_001642 [Microbotryomycetes sp. JL221]